MYMLVFWLRFVFKRSSYLVSRTLHSVWNLAFCPLVLLTELVCWFWNIDSSFTERWRDFFLWWCKHQHWHLIADLEGRLLLRSDFLHESVKLSGGGGWGPWRKMVWPEQLVIREVIQIAAFGVFIKKIFLLFVMSVMQRKLGRPILKSKLFSEALRYIGRMMITSETIKWKNRIGFKGIKKHLRKGHQIKMLLSGITTFIIEKRLPTEWEKH